MRDLSLVLALTAIFVASAQVIECAAVPPHVPSQPRLPVHTLDLDASPETRWTTLVTQYVTEVQGALAFLRDAVPKEVLPLLVKIAGDLERYIPEPYGDEIRGIAAAAGMELGDVVLLNFVYELSAFCTSIVAEDKDGNIVHGRNLDFGHPEVLRNITVQVDFRQGNRTVYSGTTYVGYTGLATAQKPHGFTVSLNERDMGAWWENALEAVLDHKAFLVSHAIRHAVAVPDADFSSAMEFFTSAHLIAPAYLIVGGVRRGEGAVIRRSQLEALAVHRIGDDGNFYVLKTNYDSDVPPPKDDNRRTPGMQAMNATGRALIAPDTLYNVLSVHPVLNDGTTYTSIMAAANPELFYTVVRRE